MCLCIQAQAQTHLYIFLSFYVCVSTHLIFVNNEQRVRQFIVNKTKQHVGFSFIFSFILFLRHILYLQLYLYFHASFFTLIYRFYLPNGKVGLQRAHTHKSVWFLPFSFSVCFIRHHILLVLFLLLLKAQINTIWHYLFSFYFTSLYCCSSFSKFSF